MAPNSNSPTYFACHMCGECCSSWSIPIEREKADVLLTRDWVRTRLSETRRELTPLSKDEYRLPLTDDNVCVFLDDSKRCMIEVHEGPTLKPTDCKRFPFAAVKMPNHSTLHDTSAVCKHISEKLLLAFEPIRPKPQELPDLVRLFSEEDGLETFPERFKLDFGRSRPWQELSEVWEPQLKAIFSAPDCSTEDALRQAAMLIRRWPKASTGKKRGAFHLADWMTVCFLRKPYGTLSWLQLLRGKQYEDPRVFGNSIDLGTLRKTPWGPSLDHHLNAFLFNLLTRKRLLSRGASLQSLLALGVIAALLVRWYTRVLASFRPEARVETADVTLAIRLVERYYTGHQPRFLRQFSNRWRGTLLLWLIFG